jgi:hypothetical protein
MKKVFTSIFITCVLIIAAVTVGYILANAVLDIAYYTHGIPVIP